MPNCVENLTVARLVPACAESLVGAQAVRHSFIHFSQGILKFRRNFRRGKSPARILVRERCVRKT